MLTDLYVIIIGIEAQLLSQTDIDGGMNVSFPSNKDNNNVSVLSNVPNPTISM